MLFGLVMSADSNRKRNERKVDFASLNYYIFDFDLTNNDNKSLSSIMVACTTTLFHYSSTLLFHSFVSNIYKLSNELKNGIIIVLAN